MLTKQDISKLLRARVGETLWRSRNEVRHLLSLLALNVNAAAALGPEPRNIFEELVRRLTVERTNE